MNDDEPRVSREGESFYEAPGCHHIRGENACKKAGEEASFYAVFIVDDEYFEKEGYDGLLVLDAAVEENQKHEAAKGDS